VIWWQVLILSFLMGMGSSSVMINLPTKITH
jgi:hypothetical protein